jgi:hypothetical protein
VKQSAAKEEDETMTREDLRTLAEVKAPFVNACIRLEDAKRQMVEAML